ncbi:MAG: hypothetical protein II950_01225 [Prevotella sp.]|nr:hypothetical protein [Prevotella sp.]
MKNFLFLFLTVLTTCESGRIIYGYEDVIPQSRRDSISIDVKNASVIFFNMSPYINIEIEIQNEKSIPLYLSSEKSYLILYTEHEALQYKNTIDTLGIFFQMLSHEAKLKYKNGTIPPYEKKQQNFSFEVNGTDYITYKSMKEKRYKLFLSLDLKDENGNKIEKKIILVPIKYKKYGQRSLHNI